MFHWFFFNAYRNDQYRFPAAQQNRQIDALLLSKLSGWPGFGLSAQRQSHPSPLQMKIPTSKTSHVHCQYCPRLLSFSSDRFRLFCELPWVSFHSFHLIRIAVRHLHLSILIFTIVLLIVLIFIASPLCPLRSLRLIDRHSLRRRTAKHARRGARLLGGLLRFCDLPRELEGAGEFGESVGSAFCVG